MVRNLAARFLPVAALAAALMLAPLPLRAADGDWQAQYWSNRFLSGAPSLVRTEKAVSFEWGFGSPATGLPPDNWSARWTKSATFAAGWYRFRTLTDDGVRVWVDGQPVIDQWFDMPGVANTGDIYLAAGTHVVKVEYYEHAGWARAYLSWTRFSGEPEYTGWKGEYFNDRNLSGDPVFIRDDPKVDFDWGWGDMYPGVGLGADDFSVRWTRRVRFDAGYWRFKASVSDGVRIYVDDRAVVDSWREQETTLVSGDVFLTAGEHEVKVEYFEGRGRAIVRVDWERVSAPPQVSPTPSYTHWRGEYFTNRYLSGLPALVRDDTDVRFNWGLGAPAGGIPDDGFSARWTRTLSFAAGTYRFYVHSDDGARLWVDGQLVVDRWHDQAATTHYGDAALSAGLHSVRLEYYENAGFAEISLWWEPVAKGDRWQAEYFNNTALSGAPAWSTSVSEIRFDWGDGSPGPGVAADRFSARYTMSAQFAAGLYTFRVRSDDGVRLWVDEQLALDRWVVRSAADDEATLHLSAGEHRIRLEYFEDVGLAELRLSWEKREDATITAWKGEYFTNPWLIGYPTVTRADAAVDFNWGSAAPAPGIPADNFSARWTRLVALPAARTLTFSLRTDDGARLWVDGVLLLDRWYDQVATTTHTTRMALPPGVHTIVLEYYEHGGLASVWLSWQ